MTGAWQVATARLARAGSGSRLDTRSAAHTGPAAGREPTQPSYEVRTQKSASTRAEDYTGVSVAALFLPVSAQTQTQ